MELGILSKLNFMRKNSILCDLNIKTNDKVVIKMHRIVWLAAFVDTTLLKSQFTTEIEMDKPSNLHLPNVSGKMLKTIVDFIYGEKIKDIPDGLQENLEKLGFSKWRFFLPEPFLKTDTMVIKQEPIDDDIQYNESLNDSPPDSLNKKENCSGYTGNSDKTIHSRSTTHCGDKDNNQNDPAKSSVNSDIIASVKTESENCEDGNQIEETYNHGRHDENRSQKQKTNNVPSFRISFVEHTGICKEEEREKESMPSSITQSYPEVPVTATDQSKDTSSSRENECISPQNVQESPKKQPTILPKFSNDETQVKTLATFSPVFEYVKNSNGEWVCNSKKLLPVPLSKLGVDLPTVGSEDQTAFPMKVINTGGTYMYETNAVKAISTDEDGNQINRYLVPPEAVNALENKLKHTSRTSKKPSWGQKKIVHVNDIVKKKRIQEKQIISSYGSIAITPKTDSQPCGIINSSINVASSSVQIVTGNFTAQTGQNSAPYQVTSQQPGLVLKTPALNLVQSKSNHNAGIIPNNPSQHVPLQNTNNSISICNAASGFLPLSSVPQAIQPVIQPNAVPFSIGSGVEPLSCPSTLSIGSTFQPLTMNGPIVGNSIHQNQNSGSTAGLIQTQNFIAIQTPRIVSLGPEDFNKSDTAPKLPLSNQHTINSEGKRKKFRKPEGPVKLREIKPKPSGDAALCTQGPQRNDSSEKSVHEDSSYHLENSNDSSLSGSTEKDNQYVIYDAINDFENLNQRDVSPSTEEHIKKKLRSSSLNQKKGRKSSEHLTLLAEPIEKYMSKFAKRNSTKHLRKIKMDALQRKRRCDVSKLTKKSDTDSSSTQVTGKQSEENEDSSVDVKVEVSDDSSFVTVFLDTGGSDEEDRKRKK